MAKIDNRVLETATSASQPTIKVQEKSALERRCGVALRRSEKSWQRKYWNRHETD